MTPKEKAIELYNKMYETGFKPKSVLIRIEQAKECALIAVDEIMNVIIGSYDYELEKIYWQDVKNEIELL
jgi:hypothetical protein